MAPTHSNSKNNDANGSKNVSGDVGGDGKSATFHDFLGSKGTGQDSASASGGGNRPPHEFSSAIASEQGSERPVCNHLEGIPFYGSRDDLAGPESSFIFNRNKRSTSDSFMIPSKDKFSQGLADSQDNPVFTKLMRYSTGERSRHPLEEDTSFAVNQMRPVSGQYVSQPSYGDRTDHNHSKWDRSNPMNLGPISPYTSHTGLMVPHGYQSSSNKIKDTNMSSVVSQIAADEGSRTGIKGSGILSSINVAGGLSGRQPAGVLIRTGKQKSGVNISEPEPSTPSQSKIESTGRQMTIFYAGQAHVFDNIHPNKADVIMALAGSNGGSWSTVYTPNLAARQSTGENRVPIGESDVGTSALKELQGKSSDKRDFYHGFGSGSYQGGIRSKENTENSFKEANMGAGDKTE